MTIDKRAGRPKGPKRPPATSLRLNEQYKRAAWQSAKASGTTLTEWVDDAMLQKLRREGRKMSKLQQEQWAQLGIPMGSDDQA